MYTFKNLFFNIKTTAGVKKSVNFTIVTPERTVAAVSDNVSYSDGAFDILSLVRGMEYNEVKKIFELPNGNYISVHKSYEVRNGVNFDYVDFLVNIGGVDYGLGSSAGTWFDTGAVRMYAYSLATVCTHAYFALASVGVYKVFAFIQTFNGDITDGEKTGRTLIGFGYNPGYAAIGSQTALINNFLAGSSTDIYDPYASDDNQTPQAGFADFDYTGDDVDVPALPSISAAASGFVRLYNPTITEVQNLSNYLWSGAFDLATYKKLFGNPMDCFLSFGIIPVTPPRSANKESISFANMPDPGVTAYKLTSQFTEFDCGSVTINSSKYTGSAMDYSPYTKAELFLPFCGTHSLAVDDIMDSTISIKYHTDLYTGACVAFVKITRTNSDGSTLDSVLYQFTGNILATIPLTGADHSNFIQSMLFMGAAVAATVATSGGAAPEIGGAMAVGDSVSTSALGGAAISASGINAVMSMKPNVIRSGNLSANAGFLGLKKPVITLTCPNLCRPEDENKLAGMPCQKSGTLSDFSGFNIVSACHLDNIPCTMEELRMIDTALAKGVII